jgi:hypothetical protein
MHRASPRHTRVERSSALRADRYTKGIFTLNITEVARLQNCSERNARNYCLRGLGGKVLRSTLVGKSREVSLEDFKQWRAECGFPPLPEPEPKAEPAPEPAPEVVLPYCEVDDPVVPVETAPAPDENDLETWDTESLKAAVLEWCKPDDPNGVPSNEPSVGSSTRPSPQNFARFTTANAILMKRRYATMTPPVQREWRQVRASSTSTVDQSCKDHNSLVANLGFKK